MPFLQAPTLRDRLAREGQLGVAAAVAHPRPGAGGPAAGDGHRGVPRGVNAVNILFDLLIGRFLK